MVSGWRKRRIDSQTIRTGHPRRMVIRIDVCAYNKVGGPGTQTCGLDVTLTALACQFGCSPLFSLLLPEFPSASLFAIVFAEEGEPGEQWF